MGFGQHKNHPVVSPSLPNPTWRSNGIIPEQASTPPHHHAQPLLAHTEDLNLRDGKEAQATATHSQDSQGSLCTTVLGTTSIHRLSRNWDCAAEAKASAWLVLREVQELGTHRSRDFWEAAGGKGSSAWLQTLCITKCNQV